MFNFLLNAVENPIGAVSIISRENNLEYTPCHTAIKHGHLEIMKICFSKNDLKQLEQDSWDIICTSDKLLYYVKYLSPYIGSVSIPVVGTLNDAAQKASEIAAVIQTAGEEEGINIKGEIKNYICGEDWEAKKKTDLSYWSNKKNFITSDISDCVNPRPMLPIYAINDVNFYLCELEISNQELLYDEVTRIWRMLNKQEVKDLMLPVLSSLGIVIATVFCKTKYDDILNKNPTYSKGQVAGKIVSDITSYVVAALVDCTIAAISPIGKDNQLAFSSPLVKTISFFTSFTIIPTFTELVSNNKYISDTVNYWLGFDNTRSIGKAQAAATKQLVMHRNAYDMEWIYLAQAPARCLDHAINGNKNNSWYREEVKVYTIEGEKDSWRACYSATPRTTEHLDTNENWKLWSYYSGDIIGLLIGVAVTIANYNFLYPFLMSHYTSFASIVLCSEVSISAWYTSYSLEYKRQSYNQEHELINTWQLEANKYIGASNRKDLYLVQAPGHCLNKETYGYFINNNLSELPEQFIGISFNNEIYKLTQINSESESLHEQEIGILCKGDKNYVVYSNKIEEIPTYILNKINCKFSYSLKKTEELLNFLTTKNFIERPLVYQVKNKAPISIERTHKEGINDELYQKLSSALIYNKKLHLSLEDKDVIFNFLLQQEYVHIHKAQKEYKDDLDILKWTICGEADNFTTESEVIGNSTREEL